MSMLNLKAKYLDRKGQVWEVVLVEIHRHLLSKQTVVAVSSDGELFEDFTDKFYDVEWPAQKQL